MPCCFAAIVAGMARSAIGEFRRHELRDLAGMFRARFACSVLPSSIRGRRECRAPDAPASRVCKNSGSEHTRWSGHTGNRPAFPAQWFTAYFVLSPATGFFATVISGTCIPANLMPASGHQDHTTSPSASRAVRQRHIGVHRIPSRVRDDRETPLGVGRDGGGYRADLGLRKIRIFLQKGLDRHLVICPSGSRYCRPGQASVAPRDRTHSFSGRLRRGWRRLRRSLD